MIQVCVTATLPPATVAVRCNGLTFPVLVWGADGGRPMLLLHGFPQEPATWGALAEALVADGFQIFAPSQRGYVATARPQQQSDYTFPTFVSDAVSIMDALQVAKVDLAGFGVGALQAWMVAAYHPSRIRSLTALRYPHPAAFADALRLGAEQTEKWASLQQQFGPADIDARTTSLLDRDASGLFAFLQANDLPQPFLSSYVQRLREPGALRGALSWVSAVSVEELAQVPPVSVPTLYIWSEGPGLAAEAVAATRSYARSGYSEIRLANSGNFMLEKTPASLIPHMRRHLRAT